MIYEKITTYTWDYAKGLPECPAKGAFEIEYDGDIYFVVDGLLHREDGPAFIWPDYAVFYYRHGELHREDGPAADRPNGTKTYYKNGKLHREDGPAVIYSDGSEEYYLFDKQYTKEEWEPLAIQLGIKGEIL